MTQWFEITWKCANTERKTQSVSFQRGENVTEKKSPQSETKHFLQFNKLNKDYFLSFCGKLFPLRSSWGSSFTHRDTEASLSSTHVGLFSLSRSEGCTSHKYHHNNTCGNKSGGGGATRENYLHKIMILGQFAGVWRVAETENTTFTKKYSEITGNCVCLKLFKHLFSLGSFLFYWFVSCFLSSGHFHSKKTFS